MTENLSAKDLAEIRFSAVAYPWTLVAAKLKSIRETLEELKKSMPVGPPPMILSYSEVCEGVGFNKYWVGSPNLTVCGLGLTRMFRTSRNGISLRKTVWLGRRMATRRCCLIPRHWLYT